MERSTEEGSTPRRGVFGRRLRVALVVNLALFGGVELGLRVFGAPFEAPPLRFRFPNRFDVEALDEERPIAADDELFWDLRPGARVSYGDDRINADALRGPAIQREHPPSTLRIAVLGDSCTFGVGVEYGQTFGARLEEGLRARHPGRRVEVLNGGVPGYTILQGELRYRRRIRAFEPDVLVLYFGAWNDFGPAMSASDRALAGADPPRSALERWNGFLLHSRIVRALQSRYGSALRFRHWRGAIDEWMVGEPSAGYRVPLEDFRAILERWLADCRASATDVILVLPDLNDAYRGKHGLNFERLDRYRAALADAARRGDLPTVDLRTLFAGEGGEGNADLFMDVVHPTPRAHRLLAAALEAEIVARGWIDAGPR